ncbi:MAG: NAD(P)H-dependent oxidoreductase subunit E [Dehalococcoidia bacterium]|nr:NAD(P)H-dependent oxidoreductase subunit E [Dehalococcoidia bacterium]
MRQFKVKAREDLLVALQLAQRELGHIPRSLMIELAATAGVPVAEVYGVASFYSFLSIRPLGRHVIRVCKSLPCHIRGAEALISSIAKTCGLKPGETSPDGRFSFQLVNCIGACDGSPAMMIDDDVYVNLTPGSLSAILEKYR